MARFIQKSKLAISNISYTSISISARLNPENEPLERDRFRTWNHHFQSCRQSKSSSHIQTMDLCTANDVKGSLNVEADVFIAWDGQKETKYLDNSLTIDMTGEKIKSWADSGKIPNINK